MEARKEVPGGSEEEHLETGRAGGEQEDKDQVGGQTSSEAREKGLLDKIIDKLTGQ